MTTHNHEEKLFIDLVFAVRLLVVSLLGSPAHWVYCEDEVAPAHFFSSTQVRLSGDISSNMSPT